MATTAGSLISQTDMAAMATLANSNLLPVINTIGSDFWSFNLYDKYDGGYPGATGGSNLISPQPNYAFTTVSFSNLVPPATNYNGSGKYVYTVVSAGDFEILVEDGGFIVAGVTYGSTERAFYVKAAETITLLGTAGQPVRSKISVARNWLSEYNRIRADLFGILLESFTEGNGGMYLNAAAIVSGPWVVGVNDPVTYPITPYPIGDYAGGLLPQAQGTLNASYPGVCEAVYSNPVYGNYPVANNMATFSGVGFICTQADAAGLTVTGSMIVANSASPMNCIGNNDVTIAYTTDTTGALVWVLIFAFTYTGGGAPPAAPPTSGFTLSSPAHVVWSTLSLGAGNYQLIATYTKSVSSGGSDSSECKITAAPANFSVNGAYLFYSTLAFGTVSTTTNVNALHPTANAVKFTVPDNGTHSRVVFTATNAQFAGTVGVNTVVSAICNYSLSNPLTKGVWVGTTLPVPGNNVFIDQCMPPYINTTVDSEFNNPKTGIVSEVAISENILTDYPTAGGPTNPFATTMQQASPLGVPDIARVLPGLAAQPAQWLVRRSTDFVPFDFGFNENIEHTTYHQQLAGGYYIVSVPSTCTGIKIRLVQVGTVPGWRGGGFQYGVPISTPMQIYVKQSGYPSLISYDFFTANNAVSIPTDGGLLYLDGLLNNGFQFLIYDPNNTGVEFDLYVELDFGAPQRIYFPPIAEVFSYCLDGTPKVNGRQGNSGNGAVIGGGYSNKPIPQSGYCVFKVRATRLPVLNSAGIALIPATGDMIVITLGQNKLITGPPSPFTPPGGMGGGAFGGMGGVNNAPGMGGMVGTSSLVFTPFLNPDLTNLTITIPAMASSTGDVEVFIVCLAGNEVVWQASEAVKVEVYANFQPIWFNVLYGQAMHPIDTTYSINYPYPTVFIYGLAFASNFQITAVGLEFENYPLTAIEIPPFVTYPIDHNIYSDMMTCLALIA